MKRFLVLAASVLPLLSACAQRGPGDLGPIASGTTTPTTQPSRSASSTPSVSPTTVPTRKTMTYQVWFTHDQSLFVTERTEPANLRIGTASVTAMLQGPSPDERAAGVGSVIPNGSRLLGLTIDNGIATADLSREFESGGGSASMRMRLAQLTFTLTQFATVEGVNLEIEETPVRVFGGEGIVLDRPMTRRGFRDLLPAILVQSPIVGQRASSPITISGTSDVFEAVVSISVLDARRNEIVRTFTMATCGSGCRGTYSKSVHYRVAKTQQGVVRVYESSAKDGSAINVVEIPVTLVA
jgi:Immunoglobulin-like domain of bacterial spore germination/Sporulation and spore germination